MYVIDEEYQEATNYVNFLIFSVEAEINNNRIQSRIENKRGGLADISE